MQCNTLRDLGFLRMANKHFFKPLLPGFHTHLKIPEAFFLKHMDKNYNEKTAKLRSDASEIIWEVKIEDGPILTDGWREFALAHDLQIGDFVVFRQERNMAFHVTVLGHSCCEIHYKSCLDNEDKDSFGENLKRETKSSSSSDPSCFVAKISPATLRYDTLCLPKPFSRANGLQDTRCGEIVLMNEKVKSWTLLLRVKKSCGTSYIRRGWRSFCNENGLKAGSFCTFKLTQRGTTRILVLSPKELEEANEVESLSMEDNEYNDEDSSQEMRSSQECSKRKAKKRRLACKASSSSPSQTRFLTVTLTPSLIKESRLYLPLLFTEMNGINKETKMTLLDKYGVNWSMKLRSENRSKRIRFVGRWKNFFKANSVEIGESIVLELIWKEDTSCVLKFCSKVKPEIK